MNSYSITSFHSINDVPPIFDELFLQASKKSFFLSREWFALLEQSVFQGTVLVFTVTSKEGVPLLVLPCYESFDEGKQLHSLANYYSSLYMPLIDLQYPAQAELLDALVKKINHYKYQSISFQFLDNKSAEYSLLCDALKKNAYYVEPWFCFGNWFEPIQSIIYSEYYQRRPSRLKNTIRRKEKKLSDYHIIIESDYDEIKQLLPHYQTIYSSSWKVEEAYPLFIENMVLRFAKLNQIRIGIAYIHGIPAAAQLWFVTEGFVTDGLVTDEFVRDESVIGEEVKKIASIFKLAYDPEFKSTSIGSILTSAMFEYVIEVDQVKEVDYLSGDDAYKKDWMSQRRERWGIVAYNKKTLQGFMRTIKRLIIMQLKKMNWYQWYKNKVKI